MIEVETAHGTIQVLYQISLGEVSIVVVVSLLIILLLLKWLIGNIWSRGRWRW